MMRSAVPGAAGHQAASLEGISRPGRGRHIYRGRCHRLCSSAMTMMSLRTNQMVPEFHHRNFSGLAAGKLRLVQPSTDRSLSRLSLLAVPRAARRPNAPRRQQDDDKSLVDRIKASTSLDELLGLIEQNCTRLDSDAVSQTLSRAAKLKQQKGRRLSNNTRDRLRAVVSEHLERHIVDRTSDYNAFSLASCSHKLAKMSMGEKSTFRAIDEEAITKMKDFKPRGFSNLLWAFATAEVKAPRLFEAVAGHLEAHPGLLKDFIPQNFSMLLWAYATAGEPAPKLFQLVDAHLEARLLSNPGLLDRFKPQGFSNLLWAYAKAGEQAPKLFEAVAGHLEANPGLMDRFKPQGFSNLLWAYATAGEQAPKLFEAVAGHLEANPGLLGDFKPQGFSNLLWAFATAGVKAPKLFEAVDAHLEAHHKFLGNFIPQHFANLLWAFATAEVKAPRLFEAVAGHLEANPGLLGDDFFPQGFSMLLWAYAKAEEPAPKLFQLVDAHLEARLLSNPGLLDRFKPQDFSMLLWAYATAKVKAPKLFAAVAGHLEANPGLLGDFTPQDFSMLLWVYAEQRHDAPELLDVIRRQAVQRMAEFTPQNLAMTARACAVLYHHAPDIIEAALQRAVSDPRAFTPQHLVNIMYAAAVFEQLDAATIMALAAALASTELEDEECRSVFQSCLVVQLSSADYTPSSLLPGPMHKAAIRLWKEQVEEAVRPPGFKNDDALQVLQGQMGLKCHPDWSTPDGLFSVNIMVELPPSKEGGKEGGSFTRVAVELDWPFRFTSNYPYKALGPTRLRRRLLEARVDRVVSVPFYDWGAAKTAAAKKRLLERLIFQE